MPMTIQSKDSKTFVEVPIFDSKKTFLGSRDPGSGRRHQNYWIVYNLENSLVFGC